MIEELAVIPNKLYFSISEVSNLCNLKAHVLRYWEQEFPQLKPVKRRGNRRYYQRKDVLLIREIQHLLYEEGFTIEGARLKISKGQKAPEVGQVKSRSVLKNILHNLEQLMLELEQEITSEA